MLSQHLVMIIYQVIYPFQRVGYLFSVPRMGWGGGGEGVGGRGGGTACKIIKTSNTEIKPEVYKI